MSTTEAPRRGTAPPAPHVGLASRPEAAGRARRLAETLLQGLRPAPNQDAAEAVVLVGSELITTGVRHAGGPACSPRGVVASRTPGLPPVEILERRPVPPFVTDAA
ncbi:hypothetical protein ACGFWI_05985 [Streptomyces sp. NPDC048434]|uniref:hypothetical protein n=1 Tax=Streptomyces sp. NPDC048434 TaxID=3365549 RepID=UPI00371333B7